MEPESLQYGGGRSLQVTICRISDIALELGKKLSANKCANEVRCMNRAKA